jgi:outer membrane protein assembly factor BamB
MATAVLTDTPSPTWSASVQVMPDTSPVFGFGAVLYADAATGHFKAVDFQTGKERWTAHIPPGALQSPVIVGAVAYLTTDSGELYAVNAVTGAPMWSGPITLSENSLTTPVPGLGCVAGAAAQPVLYLMDQQNVYLVPTSATGTTPPTPRTVYTATGATFATSLTYDAASGLMIVNTSQGLTALSADIASESAWEQAWQIDLGGYVTPATLAMGTAFVGTPAQTLALVDVASGGSTASQALASNIEQPIAVDVAGNVAYVPTDSGTIYQLDATSTSLISTFQPGEQVTTPITFSDGLGYFGSADHNLYGFDLADAPSSIISLEAEDPIAYLAGVSSGTAYFGTATVMQAASFADLIHEFNSQSQLMVDFVDPQGTQAYQQAPAYQTNVVLYDPEGNVRPFESVKVWASAPVTLMTDNQTFAIDPDTPAAFQSDGTGRIVLGVQSNTTITPDAPCGLSTPALTLWASFMEEGERILIFADERLHTTLQTISGTDLQSATTYNQTDPSQPGPALLPGGFQGSKGLPNANALAGAINNTVALQQQPTAAVPSSQYLANPQTMVGVSYSPTPPDTTRPAGPGQVPNWTLDLSDPANVTFTPQADADAALRPGITGNVFDDIAHFIENVINGVETIVKTIWQAAEGLVQAAIQTAENTYKFVIQTVEDAAHVVLGILKSVLQDVEDAVEKVIEALSFLFNWKDILATHTHIKALINGGFTQVTTFIGKLETETDAFFADLTANADSQFTTLIGSLDSTTLGTAAGSTDPNQAYTTDGSDNYSVQGNWLHHKTMTNAVGTNGQVTIGAPPSVALLGASATSPIDTIAEAMVTFVEEIGDDAVKVAEDLGQTIEDAAKELMQVLLGSGGARGQDLKNLLEALEALVNNLIALAQAATDAFFTLLRLVLDAIVDMLDAPIDIPFISWLYSKITGDQLTILDLLALIVAIPVTVMYKAITGQAPFATTTAQPALTASSETLNVPNMITTFDGLIYTFVDAISNAMGNESPPFLSYGQGVLIAIQQGVSVPYDAQGDEFRDWGLLWLYGCFPVLWNVHAGMQQGAGQSTSNAVLPTWGVGSAIWQGVYAGMYPDEFFEDGIKLVQNECGALSTIAGYAKLSDNEEVLAVLVIVDFFLDMANALIEIKFWHD